jgi:uncharacterized protein
MKSDKLPYLITYLQQWRRAVLLFSGGLDSSLLLAVGARALGPGLTALTFTGPHTAPGELAHAVALARRLEVRHLVRAIDPLALPAFRGNTPDRCYVCKRAVITRGRELAAALDSRVIWDGTNRDDLEDFRPGLRAARELGVASPLLEAGLGKGAIRNLSRRLGLPWDRAPQSCLATRFPYNTKLTAADLARVGRAEAWLGARGLGAVRLRVNGSQARLELPLQDWAAFLDPEVRGPFLALLNRLGWTEFSLAPPQSPAPPLLQESR